MKKGFTLIELLVVVLIIGILSAVALPQYTKTVTKARFAEAMTNLKTIYSALQVCELEKGENNCSFDDLAIDVPGTYCEDGCGGSYCSGYQTQHFVYGDSCMSGTIAVATAGYKDEDVCLCMFEDGLRVIQNDGCANRSTSFDYAKLLNIPEVTSGFGGCSCC